MGLSQSDQQTETIWPPALVDYAIELLTFAATDYSKANLAPTAAQFELVTDLINRGFITGQLVRNASDEVTGILVGEITQAGNSLLIDLQTGRKNISSLANAFVLARRFSVQSLRRFLSKFRSVDPC